MGKLITNMYHSTKFQTNGFVVVKNAASERAVHKARRSILLEIKKHGLTPDEIREWQGGTFFPWLRSTWPIWDPLPKKIANELLGVTWKDIWAEPQILLKFPDEAETWDLQPHTDELPPWAYDEEHLNYHGMQLEYKGVIGVALSDQKTEDGPVTFWAGSHRGENHGVTQPELDCGDAVVFHPNTGHSGGLNRGATVRMSIYYRLLTPKEN